MQGPTHVWMDSVKLAQPFLDEFATLKNKLDGAKEDIMHMVTRYTRVVPDDYPLKGKDNTTQHICAF